MYIRNEKLKKGLQDFINYIKKDHDTKELTLLEIGTFHGESTEIFAKEFKTVTTVDAYDFNILDDDMIKNDLGKQTLQDIEAQFVNDVMSKYPNIIKIKDFSLEYAKKCKKKFDVIYIDAKHEYEFVIEDIKAWLPKAKIFISGHDYLDAKPGVKKAVAEMFEKPDATFQDHSWIVKIKKAVNDV